MAERPGPGTPGDNMRAFKGSNPPPARGNRNRGGRLGAQFGPARATATANAAETSFVAPSPPPPASPTPDPSAASESAAPDQEPFPSPAPAQQSNDEPGWTRMEVEEYSGPTPTYVQAGEDASGPVVNEDGDEDELPVADDTLTPLEQPIVAAAQTEDQESEQITTVPATWPAAVDPAPASPDPPLASPEEGAAGPVDPNTGMAAVTADGDEPVDDTDESPAKRIKLEPSAESAAATEGSRGPAGDDRAEIVTPSQDPAATTQPAAPTAPASTAASPAGVSAPIAAPASVPAPAPQPVAQPAARGLSPESRAAFDAAMDEAFGPGHPHANLFDNICEFLGQGHIARTEPGGIAVVVDEQGGEYRGWSRIVDSVQAEGLGIDPSQYEQDRTRRMRQGLLDETFSGRQMREAAEATFRERLGSGVSLAEAGKVQDGEAASDEDSQGDVELPGR